MMRKVIRKGITLSIFALVVLPFTLPARALESPRTFSFMVSANGMKARFDYDGLLDQFDSTTGWVAGDRMAYRCAYTFLESHGVLVARITFVKLAGYVIINDKYMREGIRHFDGTLVDPPGTQSGTCPYPASEVYENTTEPIGPVPVNIFSDANGRTLEVRNYAKVVQIAEVPSATPWTFQITAATPNRVTVVGYQAGVAELVVYYDRLVSSIFLTSNGIS